MSAEHFEALEAVYEEVIDSMPDTFDAHEFILKLAQRHQRLYVQALIEYAESERPFQIAHGQIAQRLRNFPNLVAYDGEHNSKDIFLQVNSASLWRKVR
ncbi:MAG: hypothetical protein QY328_10630 [Anaerolineales bacterium]|nr:MAG: hypothetical protein QY328_10630 [Anaerolineales bacterium]